MGGRGREGERRERVTATYLHTDAENTKHMLQLKYAANSLREVSQAL